MANFTNLDETFSKIPTIHECIYVIDLKSSKDEDMIIANDNEAILCLGQKHHCNFFCEQDTTKYFVWQKLIF